MLSAGMSVLAPNVRGSTGYGRAYMDLDNVRKRMDSVADLAHAVQWLRDSGRADPHRIAVYAHELAQDFTAFYRDCRVVGATPEPVESFRIALSLVAQRTIAVALGLLGVSAPESMPCA